MFTTYSLKGIRNVLLLPGFIAVALFGSVLQGEEPSEFPLTKRTFRLGLSFHPAHKKGETPGDLQKALGEALTLAGGNAELFSHWVVKPWYEHWQEHYSWPSVEKRRAYFDLLAKHHNLRPILNFNFWDLSREPGRGLVLRLAVPPDLPESTTLASPGFRRRWITEVTQIVKEFQPAYFSLGNEIDSFYHYEENRAKDFENYITLVAESYDAIKKVSPETKVMVIFRYVEMAEKKAYHLIEKFDQKKIDVLGFTTYPRFATPADIPAGYYQPIVQRTGDVPVAFTEIGWPTMPGDADGKQHQADFLLWFLRETKQMNLDMVVWAFLHDLAPPDKKAPRSSHCGLLDYYGQAKPAWSIWQRVAHMPFVKRVQEGRP
jgi:hypothetical protein